MAEVSDNVNSYWPRSQIMSIPSADFLTSSFSSVLIGQLDNKNLFYGSLSRFDGLRPQ